MKIHLNLGTKNIAKSVEFYSTLLDSRPTKVLEDYALFITNKPPLELALDLRDAVEPSTDAHFGVYVESTEDVESAIERFQGAGLVDSVEREETCCYANQTKVWTTDPEGRRWEVYTVHEDTEERNDAEMTCCSTEDDSRGCCIA